jgi:hypothetical protein
VTGVDLPKILAFVNARLDETQEDVEDSRALSPGDLHWSMPDWLDRHYMLADIASKRRMVDWAVALLETLPNDPGAALMFQQAGDEFLRLLAAPFDRHPDFDPAWAVEGTVTA